MRTNVDCANRAIERELATTPSGNGHKPEHAPALFPQTDSGNAELFANLYGDRLRFHHQQNAWYEFRDALHQDTEERVHQLAKEAARRRYQVAWDITDKDVAKREAAWAISSESRAKIEASLALAQSESPLSSAGNDWNSNPMLLGVGNGVVDLVTGRLRPGSIEDLISLQAGTNYNPDAVCPRWLQFLEEVFENNAELIRFIHKAAGLSLTGDCREQIWFVLHGRGNNGKGVFMHTLLRAAGAYGRTIPFSTLEYATRDQIPSDLAGLVGRRCVMASEALEGSRLNEARLKMLTGQDPVTARHLFAEWFTFTPVLKLWVAVNHRPRVSDDSPAFWRRARLIPFNRSFAHDADKNLETKLAAELEGILAWAVQGCLLWQKEGLDPPQAVAAATAEWRAETNALSDFLADTCIVTPGAKIKASALYKAYRAWAEREEHTQKDTLTVQAFGRKLTGNFDRRAERDGIYYHGLTLGGGGQREGLLSDGVKDCEGFPRKFQNPIRAQENLQEKPPQTFTSFTGRPPVGAESEGKNDEIVV